MNASLLPAQVHQFPQQPVIHTLAILLQHRLLRIAQTVDKRFIEHLVPGADLQRLSHKVQQLFPTGGGRVRKIFPLQLRVGLIYHLGHLNGQLVLALKIMINVSHGAAHRLGYLLYGHIFKALPVKEG